MKTTPNQNSVFLDNPKILNFSTNIGNEILNNKNISAVAEELDLDQAIAAGDYAGWGFTVEENVLKFKNLA